MHWKFQYSLSSLLWFTLCLALVLSSVLMYRRMAKAELENGLFRASAGFTKEDEPAFFQVNQSIDIDINRHVSSIMKGINGVRCEYNSEITFRNDSPKDIKLHFPLLRKAHCYPGSCEFIYSAELEPELKQSKTVTLAKGESFNISLPKRGATLFSSRDLFDGKEQFDYGCWALVFGVPQGENPDDYVVGTVLTKPIHWKIDKNCINHGKK
jgi:hypothetical protein